MTLGGQNVLWPSYVFSGGQDPQPPWTTPPVCIVWPSCIFSCRLDLLVHYDFWSQSGQSGLAFRSSELQVFISKCLRGIDDVVLWPDKNQQQRVVDGNWSGIASIGPDRNKEMDRGIGLDDSIGALPNTRRSHRATKELEKTPGIRNAKCRRQASPWENLISGTTRYQWPKFSQASLVSSRGPECDLFSFAKLCIHSLTLELCDCLAFISLADCVSSSYDVASCGHQGAWRAAIDSVSLPIL